MKKAFTDSIRLSFFFLILIALFSSCVPQKKIKYLQRQQANDTTSAFYPARNEAGYRIQSRDNLYIRVYSLDPNASMFFNKNAGSGTYNDYANDASIYLNSYSVDKDGNIEFPILGKVNVQGQTVREINDRLQVLVSDYLKEVAVVVKLVNFKVTVLGEVGRPGEFTFYQNQVNLFEAISLAGDLNEFANRSKIALIRKTPTGSKVHYLDMNREDILQSEFYYLQPNDIIYISPLGYKRWGLGSTFPWAIVLASISTTLLLINYFQK